MIHVVRGLDSGETEFLIWDGVTPDDVDTGAYLDRAPALTLTAEEAAVLAEILMDTA
jgi:hypothetical protein